jgi:hypothetical protein
MKTVPKLRVVAHEDAPGVDLPDRVGRSPGQEVVQLHRSHRLRGLLAVTNAVLGN